MVRFLLPLALAGVLVGCSGPSVVGEWTVSGLPNLPPNSTTKAVFSSPDKVVVTVTVQVDLPSGGSASGVFTANGTYKTAGEKMELAVNDVQVQAEGIPVALQGIAKPMIEGAKGQIKTGLTRNDLKLKWEGQDKFVMTWPDGAATFDRVKGA